MAAELLHDGDRNFEETLSELRFEDLERWARGSESLPLREWIALAEAWRIAQSLRQHRGNRSATARALGIGRRTLYTKMEKLGLEPSWSVTRRSEGE
jgi:DNA-binding NtrC family response regulator